MEIRIEGKAIIRLADFGAQVEGAEGRPPASMVTVEAIDAGPPRIEVVAEGGSVPAELTAAAPGGEMQTIDAGGPGAQLAVTGPSHPYETTEAIDAGSPSDALLRAGRTQPTGTAVVAEPFDTRDAGPAPRLRGTLVEDVAQTVIPDPLSVPDDLTRVKGVGSRIATVLEEATIVSFEQLAATDAGRLRQILRHADVAADPSTWPEQATAIKRGH